MIIGKLLLEKNFGFLCEYKVVNVLSKPMRILAQADSDNFLLNTIYVVYSAAEVFNRMLRFMFQIILLLKNDSHQICRQHIHNSARLSTYPDVQIYTN